MKTKFFAVALFSMFALGAGLSGCKGGEAVDKLGELKDKACGCDGDDECIEDSKKLAKEWVEEYGDARGGDKEKAEEYAKELATCAPSVAMVLVEAAE